ncbi:unnamed protein product (macronuclear) [Paramecium tetraurelia]|uniref:EGF-like domain-containing protein n=1 Tax=Paramecium tetraurelia TaxID=5888 RepID=A0BK08_PARTE|nr:uncharacterized protein GSPATT00029505001 [Paramecium tetraurelia]CAK58875.1 unnamed protein product [Paramecium tetraurelia]|eukprot:XP_001426273.1 hypothetical protein (macronuclear) [Paramecium tetraurelia strain d4-2]
MSTFSQILYHESFTSNSFTTSEEWVLKGQTNVYSDCGTVRLLGGYDGFGKGASATMFIQLPPHHTIQITLEFWKIDTWDSEIFFIYLDQVSAFQQAYIMGGTQTCGKIQGETIQQISITKPHNFQSLFILMTSDIDETPSNESWGIRDFKLYIYPCPTGCQTCISTDSRINCIIWSIVEESLTSLDINTFKPDGWTIERGYKYTSNCLSIPLLGGYDYTGENSYIYKKINLPAHNQIKIKFRFMFIDSWNAENAYLYVDNVQVWTDSFNYQSREIQDLCGWAYDDIPHNQEITVSHSKQSITLKFTSDLDQVPTNESFGIRDIQIYIPCVFGSSFSQACGTVCGNGVKESQEQCDDGNIYAFDGCFNCEYSCVEGCSNCIDGICFECDIGWIFYSDFNTCIPIVDDTQYQIWEECDDTLQYEICLNGKFFCPSNCKSCQFGICLQCKLNYELINNRCESICQNQLILNDIQCTDYNLQPFDKCHQCYYDLQQGCQLQSNGFCIQCLNGWILDINQNICIPICGDLVILGDEQCDINKYTKSSFGCNQCEFDCQDECTDCQFGKCYDCIPGWKLKNYQCESDCGNNSIQGQEECDDMNSIRFDGCNNCRNDCQRECSYCQKGICLDCIYGWHLTDHFICEAECGDNLIALISYEECEDSNYDQFDGCYQCKTECCHYCNACVYGYCYNCEYTFTLIDQYCIPVCGDGLITVEYEQCDDMNEIPYDGCYFCNYQCRERCKLCIKGICYDKCEYGYEEVDDECIAICGDGIVVEQEDCDDQNDIQSDGCFKCKFHCPDHCEICQQGKCKLCEQGYELNRILNQCLAYCGNGMVSKEEECDDMNIEDGDGCSQQCKVEVNYVCKNYQYSFTQCTYEKYPSFEAAFIKQDYEIQYVSLHFDQQVKIQDDIIFSEYIQLSLKEIDPELYNITLIIVQEAYQYCTYVEYIVEIVINSTLSSPPVLEVVLNEQLYNENDAPLINQDGSVRLNIPKYLDDQKKQSAQVLKKMGTYIMNSMGGAGFLVLLLGNSFILRGVIEVLQQQSYLRFINVIFPLNLFIYFESTNIITVQPMLDFFNFNYFSSELVELPFVESYEKLKFYDINADLVNNIQAQIFLSLALYSVYIGCHFLIEIFRVMEVHHFLQFGESVASLLLKFFKSLTTLKRELQKDGLKQFLLANCWDLLFMSFLQIRSSSFKDLRSIFSVILGYSIIYTCALIISCYFLREDLRMPLFSQYWIKKFNLFLIFKKLLFIAILVLFQQSQEIQSMLLTLVCQIYLIYIFLFRPFQSKTEYINLIITEMSVFVFCFTVILYWNQMESRFDYDNQVILGWFHIATLLSVLIINLAIQLYVVLGKLTSVVMKKLQQSINHHQIQQMDPYPLRNVMEYKL